MPNRIYPIIGRSDFNKIRGTCFRGGGGNLFKEGDSLLVAVILSVYLISP